ncbi:MAG: glycosyltransferase [Gammaproteobacteria bacterium]|nr:glycosyltransferase [Gammaproteobacteria bacterium]
MKTIFYISYDGLLEPLGSSQVKQYLLLLAKQYRIVLLSYERQSDLEDTENVRNAEESLRLASIEWIRLRYHKRLSLVSTTWDISQGVYVGFRTHLRHGIDLVHARSYVAATIALLLKKLLRIPYLFDMRGLWVDERVDGGIWKPHSRKFRVAKNIERHLVNRASALVSLTHKVKLWLIKSGMARESLIHEVIPTCVNLDAFHPVVDKKKKSNNKKKITIGYFGNVSTWYQFDKTILFFRHLLLRYPDSVLKIVNRGDHKKVECMLFENGIRNSQYTLDEKRYEEMPEEISSVDISVFFIKPAFSKIASMPTKLGEILACGIPCITNDGIGDVAEVLTDSNVGLILNVDNIREMDLVIEKLETFLSDSDLHDRCRRVAEEKFSVSDGAKKYHDIYKRLLSIEGKN